MSDNKEVRQEEFFSGDEHNTSGGHEYAHPDEYNDATESVNGAHEIENTVEPSTDDLSTPEFDLASYVLGALDDEEMARVRRVIANNQQLQGEVLAFESVATQLGTAVPTKSINRGRSAGIRSRLIARAASTRGGKVPVARHTSELVRPRTPIAEPGSAQRRHAAKKAPKPTTVPTEQAVARVTRGPLAPSATPHYTQPSAPLPPPRPSGAIRGGVWIGLAVILAALVGGVQEWRLRQQRTTLLESVSSRDSSLTNQVASLQTEVAQKDSVIQSLIGPDMKVVDLVSGNSHVPVAKLFWDQKDNQWTMRVYNVRPPKPGKTYQVWLIANNSPAPISVGTFEPDARGTSVHSMKYDLPKDALVQVAVSEEPMGGMPTRTGPIVLAGK